ncbi:MAG TPA: TonB-dependent receptor, partial [Phenylobacterium sp.]|nr:TonB-dependent receptor [Phenylobacterium sp.]
GNSSFAAVDYFPSATGARDEQLSQEIRINSAFEGPINFIVGGFVSREERLAYNAGRGLIFGFLPPVNTNTAIAGSDVALPTAIGYATRHTGLVKTYSVFGQVTWDIADSLTLDAGARYTKIDGVGTSRNTYVAPFYLSLLAGAATGRPCNTLGLPVQTACLFVPPTDRVRIDYDEDNVSPEVTLSWRPSSDLTVYAAYKTGYKPGGVSNPIVFLESNLAGDLEFGAEKSKGGEVGAKASLLGGDLSLTGSIYRYKFSGLQLNVFDSATTSFFIRNAGSAITKGFEVQATYRVTPELTLNGVVDYNKGYFSDFRNAGCYNGQTAAQGCNIPAPGGRFLQDLSGTPLQQAPRWVMVGGFSWNHPLSNGLTLGVDGDVKHSSKYRLNSTGSPRAVQDSYTKINARIRLSGDEDRWEVALIGRNLTNEYQVIGATPKPGTGNAQDGFTEELVGVIERGRQIALQLTLRR